MSGPDLHPAVLLGVPSIAVLAGLVLHVGRNRSRRVAAAFFGALAAYGAARSLVIVRFLSPHLGSPPPYLMERPIATLAGVSLQELVGWGVAVTLSWLLSDRLLRRAGVNPGPYRVAALSVGGMAAVCLAVESAAVASGWWTWTLRLGGPALLRVPPVALVDWGFVAVDFLLPALLLQTASSLPERLVALGLFPLHFASHALVRPLPGPLPATGWDVVHLGVAAFVLARALSDGGRSALPEPAAERLAWLPACGALVVVGVAGAAALGSGTPRSAAGVVPLAALALLAGFRPRPSPPRASRLSSWEAGAIACAAAVAALAFVTVPRALKTRDFLRHVEAGAARLRANDPAGAEAELREAVSARPDNASGRSVLAWILLGRGDAAGAREQLAEALAYEPTARDSLLMAARLDLAAGRPAEALAKARLGRRVHPATAEFALLEGEAARRLPGAGPTAGK